MRESSLSQPTSSRREIQHLWKVPGIPDWQVLCFSPPPLGKREFQGVDPVINSDRAGSLFRWGGALQLGLFRWGGALQPCYYMQGRAWLPLGGQAKYCKLGQSISSKVPWDWESHRICVFMTSQHFCLIYIDFHWFSLVFLYAVTTFRKLLCHFRATVFTLCKCRICIFAAHPHFFQCTFLFCIWMHLELSCEHCNVEPILEPVEVNG